MSGRPPTGTDVLIRNPFLLPGPPTARAPQRSASLGGKYVQPSTSFMPHVKALLSQTTSL
ncbi:hypothetical protein T492DRAFT_1047906 [Pavlovales sp. CCMP2436]|nr:hypothetical protein T492DRAFT_1047906 [Pavlovales sp. CCMP2436]